MPRTEEANQKIRETQKEKILQAAWRVYARKGSVTTMAEVATEAAVSYGLAYRHFQSKEALFRALIARRLASGASGWRAARESSESPGTRLRAVITRLVENRRDAPQTAQLLRQVLADEETPEDLRRRARRHGERLQRLLRELIVKGQRAGEVAKGDPDQLVTAVIALLDGLTGMASWKPRRLRQHFPGVGIVLRMVEPNRTRVAPRKKKRTRRR